MSKHKISIQFKSIVQLWQYAQSIECHSMEIITANSILICECSQSDIAKLEHYGGLIIEDYHFNQERNVYNNS